MFLLITLLVRGSGLVTWDDMEALITQLKTEGQGWLFLGFVVLIWLDLILSVPTVLSSMLAGYLLGGLLGGLAISLGLMLMGGSAYALGRWRGVAIMDRFHKNKAEAANIHDLFTQHGPILLVVGRAVPMVPETACVMAGISQMSWRRFLLAHALGSFPYAFLLAFAGSYSSLDNPTPALMAWGSLALLLSGLWWWRIKKAPSAGETGP